MSRRLKVLRVTTVLDFGGIEKRLVNTAQHDDDDVEFVFVSLGKGGWAAREIETLGKRVILLNSAFTIPSVSLLVKLVKLFLQEKPDVVHTSGAEANFHGILAARAAGVPVIVGEEVGLPNHRRVARLVFKAVYSQCSKVVAISNAVKKVLVELGEVPPEKVVVVYNPAPPSGAPPSAVRGPGGLKLLAVCRLEKIKNLEATLRVLASLRERLPPFTFSIVGDGTEREALETLAEDLSLKDCVRFEGFHAEPQGFYASHDIFVLPSFTEGLSNSLLEAMNHGLLCVVTCAGGPAELIIDGANGFLLDPNDIASIEKVLFSSMTLSAAERLSLGQRAAQTVAEAFSLSGYISRLKHLYLESAPTERMR